MVDSREDKVKQDATEIPWWLLALAVLMLVLICVMGTCGCVPAFVQDHTECSGVVGGMLKSDENLPAETRGLGAALEESANAVSDKIGTSGKNINPSNVKKRLGETKEAAEAYIPLFQRVLGISTGSDIFDVLIMLLLGGGGFAGRKPLRGFLHALTHNPKGDSIEVD